MCWSEIQDGHHCGHLKNLFFASSPELKGQLTSNLLRSIGVACRSKIAKIVPIGNPRWPPWLPSWKSIFYFFSWTERPIDSKLARKHRGDLFKQSSWILLKMFVLMISRSVSKLVTWGQKLGHLPKSAENLVVTLAVTFFKQSSYILLKMFVLMIFRSGSQLGHLESKTRSPDQIS